MGSKILLLRCTPYPENTTLRINWKIHLSICYFLLLQNALNSLSPDLYWSWHMNSCLKMSINGKINYHSLFQQIYELSQYVVPEFLRFHTGLGLCCSSLLLLFSVPATQLQSGKNNMILYVQEVLSKYNITPHIQKLTSCTFSQKTTLKRCISPINCFIPYSFFESQGFKAFNDVFFIYFWVVVSCLPVGCRLCQNSQAFTWKRKVTIG